MEQSQTDGRRLSSRFGFINGDVLSWALWDWATSAFSSVVVTFLFAAYLTNKDLFGASANTDLGWADAIAGIVVALIAPAVGEWTDKSGKRKTVIVLTSLIVGVSVLGMFWVTPHSGLLLGLVLLGVGNVALECGSVVYNAMVGDVSTEKTVGRVSGFGWGLGYVAGIVLLLVLYLSFISPQVGLFGVTSHNGMDVRISMVVTGAWILVFALPLMIKTHNAPPVARRNRGVAGAYREVFRAIRRFWRTDRSVVWFLLSSAIYRDGLAGVFSFGGVLAGVVFGFSAEQVMVFGIAANVVAGIATILFGRLDDRIGSAKVILISLVSLLIAGGAVFLFHDGGQAVFWVFGLLLCIFVGPAQSASRTYLIRIAPDNMEGELFGLYATTGRVISFLAPMMYSTAILLAAAAMGRTKDQVAYFGILGIMLVLLAGLLTFLPLLRASNSSQADGASTSTEDAARI
ncbi:MAG: MFS transporter [Actinomycetaceae bacterium]|nr:MFS transporter [Actinomycetaceae bacterium]MDY6082479.1 MFS transporter [Actinomycetaceae bacterium]